MNGIFQCLLPETLTQRRLTDTQTAMRIMLRTKLKQSESRVLTLSFLWSRDLTFQTMSRTALAQATLTL